MFARFIPIAAGLLLAAALPLTTTKASAQLLLNEVLADPARDWNGDAAISSRDDEWVEVINTGPTAIDLSGYRLAGPDSVWRYEFAGSLAPGAVRVVYGRQSYDWETANGFPAFGLRLGNSGGEIVLFHLEGSQVSLIDCYAYTDHEADDDRSSGRGPDGGAAWILLDGHNPWTGTAEPHGTGCYPTPGGYLICATPVAPVTWSRVKQMVDGRR
ncbi:MAG: hypothetical protein FD129_1420 [bacterium]|nr:MAG: hypothetical protein FD129_1420 [bacterium]